MQSRTPLAVQWLRLYTSTVGDTLTHTAQVRPKHSYKEGKFSIMDIRAALEIHTGYRLT